MVQPEVRKPILEFGFKIRNPHNRQLIEMLRGPTRMAADLHLVVSPKLWYGEVYDGDPRKLPEFEARFREEVLRTPQLLSPYTRVTSGWQAEPIHEVPQVRDLLYQLSEQLHQVAMWEQFNIRGEYAKMHADYLETAACGLPLGEFDEMMLAYLRLPADMPVGWAVLPIETHRDPLKVKASFEGWLTLGDPAATRRANQDIAQYKKAAQLKYGEMPIDAQVRASRVSMFSGFLGEPDKKYTGFNIPNQLELTRRAGTVDIEIFMGRIAEKYRQLSARLLQTFGISCGFQDVINLVEGHEYAHGYRNGEEEARWGDFKIVGRELWATDRTVVLAAVGEVFDEKFCRGVIKGALGFATDDAWDTRDSFREPLGVNQPSLEQLRARTSDYGVGGYIQVRQAVLNGALPKLGKLDWDKYVYLAEDRDKELARIAESGNPTEVRLYLESLLDTQRTFPGVSLENNHEQARTPV